MRKIIALLVCLALVAAALFFAWPKSDDGLSQNAIASVNGSEIQKSEYDQVARSFKKTAPDISAKEARISVVNTLVMNKIIEQAARERGIKVSDKEVTEQLDLILESGFGGDEKAYAAELAKQGVNKESARPRIKSQLLYDRLFQDVSDDVKVSDADIAAYYKENAAQYQATKKRDVAHILVKDKSAAQRLLTQVQNGADFAALAKKNSIDTASAAQGGKITVEQGKVLPAFGKAAFALKNGEISSLVKSEYGWHIIRATGAVQNVPARDLAQAHDEIETTLKGEKAQEAMQKYVLSIRKKADVELKKGYTWKAEQLA